MICQAREKLQEAGVKPGVMSSLDSESDDDRQRDTACVRHYLLICIVDVVFADKLITISQGVRLAMCNYLTCGVEGRDTGEEV